MHCNDIGAGCNDYCIPHCWVDKITLNHIWITANLWHWSKQLCKNSFIFICQNIFVKTNYFYSNIKLDLLPICDTELCSCAKRNLCLFVKISFLKLITFKITMLRLFVHTLEYYYCYTSTSVTWSATCMTYVPNLRQLQPSTFHCTMATAKDATVRSIAKNIKQSHYCTRCKHWVTFPMN